MTTDTMTRSEYVRWCKDRALEEIPQGAGVVQSSLMQDFGRRTDTMGLAQVAVELGTRLAMSGYLSTPEQLTKYIEDFN